MTRKTPGLRPELTAEVFNRRSTGHLPALAGVEIVALAPGEVHSRMAVRREVMAPNGFLHAASVIALADTSCGYGCVAHLPEGASGFTTIELKANFLGTAREGGVVCHARAVHLGRGGRWRQDCAFPVHPDGLVAQIGAKQPAEKQRGVVANTRSAVLQSAAMTQRSHVFGFFYFPCLLAEGTG
jgi:1,4-dihydroxy-2-naphthoyl-CoA hydrolase